MQEQSPTIVVDEGLLRWLTSPDEPSARYFTLVDLLGRERSETEIMETEKQIGKVGWAAGILERQTESTYWDNPISCYVPKWASCVWQLITLADLGVSGGDHRVKNCVSHFLELHNVEKGGFALRPKGSEKFAPHVCMTGNMIRALAKFGYENDTRLVRAMDWLVGQQLPDGGWNCFSEDGGEHGSFKATIEPLWALAEILPRKTREAWSEAARKGAEFLLRHRVYKSDRDDSVVLLDFLRVHYPLHYNYDFLHALRVLTSLSVQDSRLNDAVKLLVEKRLSNGTWLLEGVFRGWRTSFGTHRSLTRPEEQEVITEGWGSHRTLQIEEAGKPSKWITIQALSVLKRLGLLSSNPSNLQSLA